MEIRIRSTLMMMMMMLKVMMHHHRWWWWLWQPFVMQVVDIGIDLTEFYQSVEWDILSVPAQRWSWFWLSWVKIRITMGHDSDHHKSWFWLSMIVSWVWLWFILMIMSNWAWPWLIGNFGVWSFCDFSFFGSTGCKFHHFQIFQKFLSAKINHDKCWMSPFWPGIVSYMEHDHYKGFLTSPLSLTPEIILTKTIWLPFSWLRLLHSNSLLRSPQFITCLLLRFIWKSNLQKCEVSHMRIIKLRASHF